ncbi:MAG: SDR family oxidoreductase [Alphaproteobacteria bacterium]
MAGTAGKAGTALIVGVGSGLSASLARLCAKQGMAVCLAARDSGKLGALADAVGARAYACDAAIPAQVDRLFDEVVRASGAPDLVVYNASYRWRGPVAEAPPEEALKALMISCYGGFLVGRAAARAMQPRGSGSIFFTGASASVKGFAQSATFAMGKFGLRGLAQSMARELAPKNIHVAHFVIDGGILNPAKGRAEDTPGADALLHPDSIAETYWNIHTQHRSAWTWEIELRPWVEKF